MKNSNIKKIKSQEVEKVKEYLKRPGGICEYGYEIKD